VVKQSFSFLYFIFYEDQHFTYHIKKIFEEKKYLLKRKMKTSIHFPEPLLQNKK